MKTFQIYCLKTPEGEIRYFGQTCQRLRVRFTSHLNSKLNTHVSNWIRKLLQNGNQPLCELLMSGLTKEEADEEEKALIKWGRLKRLRLTNTSDGGEGTVGVSISPENRAATRERMTGRKQSPETIEKKRRAMVGRTFSPEHRQKISQALTGKRKSSEHVENMRRSMIGKKRSPESIEKQRRASIGSKRSPETRQKISLANFARWRRVTLKRV